MHYTIYLFITLSLGLFSSCSKQINPYEKESTIILVRHAEKVDDGTRDPMLTSEGEERAERLASMLSDMNIHHIYSSDYQRTKLTATPISQKLNKEIKIYDPRSFEEVLTAIKSNTGESFLVVGHSNSTPTLANKLLDQEVYSQFDESDYSNIIIVTISGENKKSRLLHY